MRDKLGGVLVDLQQTDNGQNLLEGELLAVLLLDLVAPLQPHLPQKSDKLGTDLSLRFALPLVYALHLQLLQFLIDLGEVSSDQIFDLIINIGLVGEQRDSLTDPLIGKASQEVLIEQFDAVIDNLHLYLLGGALSRVPGHVGLQPEIQQLDSLPLDEESHPFTLALHRTLTQIGDYVQLVKITVVVLRTK